MVRIKNRYLLINFLYPTPSKASAKEPLPDVVYFQQPSSDALTPQFLIRLIRDGILEMYGEYGAGAVGSGLKVNYLSAATSTAIIRAPRNHYRLVWGALSFITKLPAPVSQQCVIRVVRVSGTIRKSEDEVIRRAKETIMKAQTAAKLIGRDAGAQLQQVVNQPTPRLQDSEGIEDDDTNEEDDEMEDVGEKIER
ncbi:hypothetical protein EJ05DRAFT_541035 [Pseudovirgaria hyperparasitica]|uniref:Ribonuclease P/MRP protein subunit POP5 n=1 Tax=Pseudovirgaria hyperparasitica TaxID=470096 RepID=A0A6A6VYP0_9PEZI|nr:uncharacterized protein EJ05DRAFT_541035 [Pseudovirgaria hyperparasitica]KAF2754427.1 hypothetical protein EJ05DRAFT_541035 [Pseudovirgaria hyperparasitica]